MKRLGRDFFGRDTAEVARDLLGKHLIRKLECDFLRGKIVETEAYYGKEDPPSHASGGKTPRSEVMWGKPGMVYVYLVYGVHLMFNVVTEPRGRPGAVLVRSVEPLEGLEIMVDNRDRCGMTELTNGPGKLTEAFGIDREENGLDLIESEVLWMEDGPNIDSGEIKTSGRIGVSEGKEEQLRFYLTNNKFVSDS
ncbi:MAG: DNA-3-methyladenine glycosylase [Candidatus Bipolaricaulota bacterium]